MMAVRAVLQFEHSTKQVADIFGVAERSVINWIAQFQDGGAQALRDLPKSGMPPSAPLERIARRGARRKRPSACYAKSKWFPCTSRQANRI